MIDIDTIKSMNRPEKIAVTKHARERLTERNITINDVIQAVEYGEIIKQYEDDRPLPSCLILGVSDNNYIHLVVSHDDEYIYLITAYYPDSEQWENDFRTRKER